MIHNTGVKVVRVCAWASRGVIPEIKKLTLKYKLKKLSSQNRYIPDDWEVLNDNDVICTTCITSLDRRLEDYKFDYVLIDEST